MMERKKELRPLLYYFSLVLGKRLRTKLVKHLVLRKCGDHIIDLPDDITSAKSILFVLPEDPLEALYQIQNIVSLCMYFEDKHKIQAIILCEKKVSPYFSNLGIINSLIEYDKSERYLFSKQLKELHHDLHKEYIDLCIFLERYPDLSLLHLIGQLQPKIRVTYTEAGEFPFFNLRIKSGNQMNHRIEQNNLIAKTLGATLQDDLQWSVSEDKIEEITLLLKESSVPLDSWLGGVDARYCYYTFGPQWTEELLSQLYLIKNTTWYLYSHTIPEDSFLSWLKARQLPVFNDIVPARLAALLYKSNVVISGKTLFFELANLLKKPAIGVFNENEIDRYHRPTPQSIGVSYSKSPNEETISDVCRKVRNLSDPFEIGTKFN